MKTLKEKTYAKIKGLEIEVKNALNDRQRLYDQLKDFKLSDNKTEIVIRRMKGLNSIIKAAKNKKQKNEAELQKL